MTDAKRSRASLLWEDILGEKTGVQQVARAFVTIFGAVVAAGAIVTGGARLLARHDAPRVGPARADGKVQVIANQTSSADGFVRLLLGAVGHSVQLNHKVIAPLGTGSDQALAYDCADGTCNRARVQRPDGIPRGGGGELSNPYGVHFKGCWQVTSDSSYGVEPLDIQVVWQSDVCPS